MKIQHNLTDYLGCEFHMNKVGTKGWLGQPSIIKSLEQKFGERAMEENKLVWDKANVESELIQELDQSENQQEGC